MHYREDRTITIVFVSTHKSEEIRLAGLFTVPQQPSALYLGKLIVRIDKKMDKVTKRLVDEFELASVAFRLRYPAINRPLEKSLLAFEETVERN